MTNKLVDLRSPLGEHLAELRARAARLAVAVETEQEAERMLALHFILGDGEFAVDARDIREVAVLRQLTLLPGASLPLYGVTQWRGAVLTVLDVRSNLGVRSHGLTDLSRLIVLHTGAHHAGILVDASRDMIDIARADIQPLPDDDAATSRSLISGMTADGVLVIDSAALLRTVANATSPLTPDQGRSSPT